MTRQLAQDAYRYVSRVYANERQQYDKMARKHGPAWHSAYIIAIYTHLRHGDDWCASKIIDAIAAELTPSVENLKADPH